jgi:hypothetical protein
MVRDTDEDYKNTLGKLNSTIGVNTDYVKRNSDRYTQQKMEIGNYKENIKAAWMEIERGNSSMKNMGIIASNVGNILRRNFSKGISNVGVGVASMVKGFVLERKCKRKLHKERDYEALQRSGRVRYERLYKVEGKSPIR